ncbi:hypothetical protein F4825DRAFT_308345 [Nemania diffusa]|nr:hypothetical protein F4825DRAFT_308345 [Nemania diffusa]
MMFQGRDADCPSGALFYTCAFNHFRGCCATDPCQSPDGCQDSETSTAATPFSTAQATSTTTISTSLLTAPTTTEWPTAMTLPGPTSIATSLIPSSTDTPLAKSKEVPVGLIAGLSVGAVVIAIASIGFFVSICRRRRRPGQHICCPLPPVHVFELEGSSVPLADAEKQDAHSDEKHEMAG